MWRPVPGIDSFFPVPLQSLHRSSEDHVVGHRMEDPDVDQPSIALLKLSSDLFKSSTDVRGSYHGNNIYNT